MSKIYKKQPAGKLKNRRREAVFFILPGRIFHSFFVGFCRLITFADRDKNRFVCAKYTILT